MPKIADFAPSPPELTEGQDYSVFLSYRSVNRPWVIALRDALTNLGHTVFLDQFVLVPGQKLDKSLKTALRRSRAGVLIWSTAAKDSEWVAMEYKRMMDRREFDESFNFIVVLLDDTSPPEETEGMIFVNFKEYPDGPNGIELLRLLHAVIGKPFDDQSVNVASQITEDLKQRTLDIQTAVQLGLVEDLKEMAKLKDDVWEYSSQVGSMLAEGMIKLGEHEQALAYLTDLEAEFPKSLRPKQLMAHALTRMETKKDVGRAIWILQRLRNEGHRDPETLGLYGKALYVEFLMSGLNKDTRNGQLLRRSRNLYREGFENSSDDTYCGINAATKTLLLDEPGSREEAAAIAAEVVQRLPDESDPSLGYWERATVAEAKLIAGHVEEAANAYQHAVDHSPGENGSHKSTRNSVRDLIAALELSSQDQLKLEEPFAHLNNGPASKDQ